MGLKQVIKNILKPQPVIYSPVCTLGESKQLEKRTVLITGGSSGIGKAIAIACANRGANVIIIGRNEAELQSVKNLIGSKCHYVVRDLNSKIEEDFFENISETPVTDLVNNAGVYIDFKSLNYTYDDFNKIFDINCRAPFMLSQYFIKYLKRNQQKGSIVFTSSDRSLMGDDGPYGMSKAAINNFVEGLARENVKYGIRVNGVAPGMTASNINNVDPNGNLYNASVRGKRIILADEIAEVVCFLLSDVSKCITGTIIPCDDGERLR